MTTQVDAVLIKLDATTDQLRKEMDRASSSVRRSAAGMRRDLSGLKGAFRSAFAPLIGGLGAASIATGIVNVGLQTEKLRASLETVTGSAEAAGKAFDGIKEFTSSTPFQINEVADAFIKLSAYGIKPTDELMRSLGNTASAMGKSLDQAVEALADATTGEFERLKEFGIRASSAGDRVAFTFRGVTTEVGKNAEEIRRYLQSIGETDFAGAMERQSNTLGGAFSNLQDAVFNLADEFGRESGLIDSLAGATRWITELLKTMDGGDNIVTRFGQGIGIAIANMQIGSATFAGQRREYIEQLEADAAALERRIRRAGPNASGESLEDSRERLRILRERIALLKGTDTESPIGGTGVTLTISGGKVEGAAGGRKATPTGPSKEELKALGDYRKSLQSLIDDLDPAAKATRDYMESVALLDRAWTRGDISGERYEELMMSLASGTEDVKDSTRELDDAWSSLGATFESRFEDAIVEGQKLREVLQGLAKDLAQIAIRKGITEPLGNAVGGFFGDLFSGFDLGSLFGNATGGLYRVAGSGGGERPVAFTAQPGELVHVIPKGASSSASTGVTVVNNIDARGADAGVEQRIRAAMAETTATTIAAIRDMKTRGSLPEFG